MKWEYKIKIVLSTLSKTDLNEYGVDGWELCSCMLDKYSSYEYIFKRQTKA